MNQNLLKLETYNLPLTRSSTATISDSCFNDSMSESFNETGSSNFECINSNYDSESTDSDHMYNSYLIFPYNKPIDCYSRLINQSTILAKYMIGNICPYNNKCEDKWMIESSKGDNVFLFVNKNINDFMTFIYKRYDIVETDFYEYNFKEMTQTNLNTQETRKILLYNKFYEYPPVECFNFKYLDTNELVPENKILKSLYGFCREHKYNNLYINFDRTEITNLTDNTIRNFIIVYDFNIMEIILK